VTVLAAHVTEALRLRVPGLPRRLQAGQLAARGPTAQREVEARAEVLAALLSRSLQDELHRDLVLVLDDVHVVDDEAAATRFLGAFVRQTPPRLHVVLSTRTGLAFPTDRLRERGEVLVLDGTDLALGRDETASWLEAALGEGSARLAARLHATTAGWPVATRMAIEDLRSTPPAARERRLAGQPHDTPFALLAQRVLGSEPAAVRTMLATVAPLGRFTAELCEELGLEGSAETIASLRRRGLFVDELPEEPDGYTLSVLAREHLHGHDPLTQERAALVVDTAAAWWAERGRHDESLRTLLFAGRVHGVAELLDRVGERLVTTGHAELVLRAVACIGPAERDDRLTMLAGVAAQLAGDWEAAQQSFEAVAGDRDPLPPGLAWRLGLIHHLRGELDEALAVYRRGEVCDPPTRDGALLLAWTATVHWLRGDRERCTELASEALYAAAAADDAQALAAAHTVLAMLAALEGDRRGNDAHYLRALDLAESAGDVLQVVRVRTNRASHHLEEGSYVEALAELEIAIELAEGTGYGPFAAIALSNRAETRLRLGQLEEALDDLLASAAIWRRISSRMVAYPLARLGDLLWLRGNPSSARARYQEALEAAEAASDLQGLVPALSGLARVELDDDPQQARELAEKAVAMGETMGLVEALLAAARAAHRCGDLAAAAEHAQRAERIATVRRDRAGQAGALEVQAVLADEPTAPVLLDRAIALWDEVGDPVSLAHAALARSRYAEEDEARATVTAIRDRMRALGCRWLDELAERQLAELEQRAPAPVAIVTLGGFRVLLAGAPLVAAAWQSRKARDLVKILIARRGRPVPREALAELLWPGDEFDKTSNRLNVALATARAVLDPDRAWPTDTYIVSEQDAVRLALDRIEVDVERFLDDASAARQLRRSGHVDEAIARLRRAEGAYAGAFLEEDAYEDWSVALREEARATYLEVATSLAAHARAAGDVTEAVRHLLRVLEQDPYDEGAHLSLVSALAEAGRHGEARRRYLLYDRAMQDLEVEPAPFPEPA